MGLKYDIKIFYGIQFDFNSVKHVKNTLFFHDFQKIFNSNNLLNFWETIDMPFIIPSSDSDEKSCIYGIGFNLDFLGDSIIHGKTSGLEIDPFKFKNLKIFTEVYDEKIKSLCQKFSLIYKKPLVIILPNFN